MFGKKKSRRRGGTTGGLTLLTEGTSFQGELDAEGDIRVDGKVAGKISCRATLIIGCDGNVEGEIHTENMRVAGRFTGNADVSGELRLESTASIDGDVTVANLDVEDGAKLNGRVYMKQEGVSAERVQEMESEPKPAGSNTL
ncbi:MAG: hypothetical protein C1941_07495 [Prosthecochloris sp.]|nr:hypothetical protein [Prosthecochloris sp.]